MTRQCWDSVDAARLPVDAVLAGAYLDGRYANEAAVRARCPQARVVTITVTGLAGAHVADCETGDLSPVSAADWAVREVGAGRKPTIYCNTSTWPVVQQECQNRGVWPAFWVAQYDGDPALPAGAVAKQYQERTDQNLDYSTAADFWPGVDPEPTPAPTPAPVEDDVLYLIKTASSPDVYVTDLLTRRHVRSQADLGVLERIGGGKAVDRNIYTLPDGSVAAIKDVTP